MEPWKPPVSATGYPPKPHGPFPAQIVTLLGLSLNSAAIQLRFSLFDVSKGHTHLQLICLFHCTLSLSCGLSCCFYFYLLFSLVCLFFFWFLFFVLFIVALSQVVHLLYSSCSTVQAVHKLFLSKLIQNVLIINHH